MSLTKTQLESFMLNDLGVPSTGNDGPLSALQYINNAGRLLCNMYGWRWLKQAPTTINTVSGNNYINMPAGLLRVVEITPAAIGERFTLVSEEDWMQMEKHSIQPQGYVGFVGGNADADGVFTHRLFIYPTPTTSVTGAFKLIYRKGWVEITSAQAGTVKMGMPDFMDPLFLEVLRAVVHGYEEDANAGVSPRIEALKASRVYQDAVAVDINSVPYKQPIRSRRRRSYEPNHTYNDLPTMS